MFIRRKEFDELKASVVLYRDYAKSLSEKLDKVCELLKYKPEYIPDSWSGWRDSSPAQIDLGNGLIRKLTKKAAQPEKYEVEESALCTSKIGGVSYANYIPTTSQVESTYKKAEAKLKDMASEAMYGDAVDAFRYWNLGLKKYDEKVNMKKRVRRNKAIKAKKFKNNKNKEK